ncbi:MAG: HAMP domain-containing histidine kinase [Eubacteriaceae bacterium]|nr:HAMP domain-containing histidine kinase [Eubacteriaceae bacterium]
MSSNSDKELKRSQRLKENAKKSADANKKKIKKFRNEKLYRRINLSFSVLNVSVTAIAVLIMLLVCIFSMRNFQKNSLTDFSRKLYDQVMAQSSHILAHDENDRVDHIFEECILPLGDMKLEVGIAVGDSYNKRADTYSFDSFYTSARETFEIEYTDFGSGEVNVQRFRHEGIPYIMINSRVDLDGYRFLVVTYQNTSDTTTYTIFLSIIVAVVLIVCILAMFLLGIVVSRKALAPLEGIAESVKSITEENLSMRIAPKHDDVEVDSLIIALNNMLQRLSTSFEIQKTFVNDVSHEMRIPLTIIQGNLDIISSWGMEDENILRECIDAIGDEVRNIKNMTERLLYLHNVTSGNYRFNPEPSRVTTLMEKIYTDTLMLTQEHEIILDCKVKEDVMILTDRRTISASLRALIDNSIKYTPDGGKITLTAMQERGNVLLIISDTGCGIEAEYLSKIFTRFYRTDSARRKSTGGSGLGLAIVKANVEAMGEDIEIKSEVGSGTTAIITLPVYIDKEGKNARK